MTQALSSNATAQACCFDPPGYHTHLSAPVHSVPWLSSCSLLLCHCLLLYCADKRSGFLLKPLRLLEKDWGPPNTYAETSCLSSEPLNCCQALIIKVVNSCTFRLRLGVSVPDSEITKPGERFLWSNMTIWSLTLCICANPVSLSPTFSQWQGLTLPCYTKLNSG